MIDHVRLLLDGDGHYTNLDVISGRVELRVSTNSTISHITVKLEGEARTRLMSPQLPPPNDRQKPRPILEVHKVGIIACWKLISCLLLTTVAPVSNCKGLSSGESWTDTSTRKCSELYHKSRNLHVPLSIQGTQQDDSIVFSLPQKFSFNCALTDSLQQFLQYSKSCRYW
jgi:hypothetical protein